MVVLPSVTVTPSCRSKQNKKHIPCDLFLSPAAMKSDIPSADGSVSSRWSMVQQRGGGYFVNLAVSFPPAWAKTVAGGCVIIVFSPFGATPTLSSDTARTLTVDSKWYGNTPHSTGCYCPVWSNLLTRTASCLISFNQFKPPPRLFFLFCPPVIAEIPRNI